MKFLNRLIATTGTPEAIEASPMTDSAASMVAILLGLGVFLVIIAVGWRSVQNRRILRLQGRNGQETIIVAGEDDDVSSVVTTSDASHDLSDATTVTRLE